MRLKDRVGVGFAAAQQRDREVRHPRMPWKNRLVERLAAAQKRDREIRHPRRPRDQGIRPGLAVDQ